MQTEKEKGRNKKKGQHNRKKEHPDILLPAAHIPPVESTVNIRFTSHTCAKPLQSRHNTRTVHTLTYTIKRRYFSQHFRKKQDLLPHIHDSSFTVQNNDGGRRALTDSGLIAFTIKRPNWPCELKNKPLSVNDCWWELWSQQVTSCLETSAS